MKRFYPLLLAMTGGLVLLLPFLLGGQVYAQAAGDGDPFGSVALDDSTLRLFGAQPTLLGLFLLTAVASLKRWVEQQGTRYTLPALAWRGIALASGILAAVLLHLSGYGAELQLLHATGWVAVLLFGVYAGAVAMGLRDLLKTLAQQRGAAVGAGLAAALPAPQAAPAQLYETTHTRNGDASVTVTRPVTQAYEPETPQARALLANGGAQVTIGRHPDTSPEEFRALYPAQEQEPMSDDPGTLPPEGLISAPPDLEPDRTTT